MKFGHKSIKAKLLGLASVLVLGQMFAFNTLKAQNFSLNANCKKDVIPFELINNLIVIPVYINNKGPFNFILDTGVGPMIITNPALIDSLALANLRQIKIFGFGEGEEIFAYATRSSTITIGNALAENLPTFVLKEDLFNLSSYIGKEISGLIGYDFFSNFIVKINYPAQSLSVYSKKSRRLRGEKIPIVLINNKPHLDAVVQPEGSGKIPVKLIIDCGASHAISLEKYNEIAFRPPSVHIVGNLGVGLSGKISGFIGRAPSLAIGRFVFKNVLASFPAPNEAAAKVVFKERNGNLGAEILKRFNVTFDYRNNVMYLQKNGFFARPFEHDMTGIEFFIGSEPSRTYFIGRIEPGSPAENLDFHTGDQIVSINFKKAEEYTFDQVTELFKSGNGKTLIIELIRDTKLLVKILKLKKRI
jgi:hypothetical protein